MQLKISAQVHIVICFICNLLNIGFAEFSIMKFPDATISYTQIAVFRKQITFFLKNNREFQFIRFVIFPVFLFPLFLLFAGPRFVLALRRVGCCWLQLYKGKKNKEYSFGHPALMLPIHMLTAVGPNSSFQSFKEYFNPIRLVLMVLHC